MCYLKCIYDGSPFSVDKSIVVYQEITHREKKRGYHNNCDKTDITHNQKSQDA